LLWRARTPRSLMCPRHMCQSLAVSSVATEASQITTLPITLHKFVVRYALRTVTKPLVALRALSVSVNLYPWAFKASNERRFFLRSGTCLTSLSVHTRSSNIFMRILLIPAVLHGTLLPIRTMPTLETTPFLGTCGYVHPELSNKASENLPLPLSEFTDRTLHGSSTTSSATRLDSIVSHWY